MTSERPPFNLVPTPPEGELVNVGALLAEVAQAFTTLGLTFTPGGTPMESGKAALHLGEVIRKASRAFAHIEIFVEKEPDSDS
jgi:hypothetical protein